MYNTYYSNAFDQTNSNSFNNFKNFNSFIPNNSNKTNFYNTVGGDIAHSLGENYFVNPSTVKFYSHQEGNQVNQKEFNLDEALAMNPFNVGTGHSHGIENYLFTKTDNLFKR